MAVGESGRPGPAHTVVHFEQLPAKRADSIKTIRCSASAALGAEPGVAATWARHGLDYIDCAPHAYPSASRARRCCRVSFDASPIDRIRHRSKGYGGGWARRQTPARRRSRPAFSGQRRPHRRARALGQMALQRPCGYSMRGAAGGSRLAAQRVASARVAADAVARSGEPRVHRTNERNEIRTQRDRGSGHHRCDAPTLEVGRCTQEFTAAQMAPNVEACLRAAGRRNPALAPCTYPGRSAPLAGINRTRAPRRSGVAGRRAPPCPRVTARATGTRLTEGTERAGAPLAVLPRPACALQTAEIGIDTACGQPDPKPLERAERRGQRELSESASKGFCALGVRPSPGVVRSATRAAGSVVICKALVVAMLRSKRDTGRASRGAGSATGRRTARRTAEQAFESGAPCDTGGRHPGWMGPKFRRSAGPSGGAAVRRQLATRQLRMGQ